MKEFAVDDPVMARKSNEDRWKRYVVSEVHAVGAQRYVLRDVTGEWAMAIDESTIMTPEAYKAAFQAGTLPPFPKTEEQEGAEAFERAWAPYGDSAAVLGT